MSNVESEEFQNLIMSLIDSLKILIFIDMKNKEGFEPPMLEETWGLKNGEINGVEVLDIKRKYVPQEKQFQTYLKGE